jgi:hypothetical protein
VLLGEQIMDVAGIGPGSRDAALDRLIATIDGIVREALETRPVTEEGD